MNIYINYLMMWVFISFVFLLFWYFKSISSGNSKKKSKKILFKRLIPIRCLAIIWSITKIWILYMDPDISNITISTLNPSTDPSVDISSDALPSKTLNNAEKVFTWFANSLEPITFRDYIPLLWKKYSNEDMSYLSQNRNFSYIWTWDELLPSFSYAANFNMIWRNILPDQQIKCKHMVVMYGIAQWRQVENPKSIDEYRLRASQNWILENGCNKQNDLVIWAYLP